MLSRILLEDETHQREGTAQDTEEHHGMLRPEAKVRRKPEQGGLVLEACHPLTAVELELLW